MMAENDNISQDLKLLSVLIDRELASVVFVRSYIQLQFEGSEEPQFPKMSVYSKLSTIYKGKVLSSNHPYFYFRLLSCIGAIVKSVDFTPSKSIDLVLTNEVVISASLNKDDYLGIEAIYFDALPIGWNVW